MLPIYIFAAILGGGLLLVGMLGGEGDTGDGVDADIDVGGKVSAWTHAFSFQTAAYFLAEHVVVLDVVDGVALVNRAPKELTL